MLSDREIFIEFLKNKNLTKTAESINVYPSTVSRAISSLEQQLKIKLVTKDSGRLKLTKEGLSYALYLQEKFQDINIFENKISTKTIEVNIIASEWFQNQIITPSLTKLAKSKLNVKLNIISSVNIEIISHDNPSIFVGLGRKYKNSDKMILKNMSETPLRVYASKNCTDIDLKKIYTKTDIENMNIIDIVDSRNNSIMSFSGVPVKYLPNSVMSTDNPQNAFDEGMMRHCPFVSCQSVTQDAVAKGNCFELNTYPMLDNVYLDVIFSNIDNSDFLLVARTIHEYGKTYFAKNISD